MAAVVASKVKRNRTTREKAKNLEKELLEQQKQGGEKKLSTAGGAVSSASLSKNLLLQSLREARDLEEAEAVKRRRRTTRKSGLDNDPNFEFYKKVIKRIS